MENPLVSVITNTYNHKDFIIKAIESVLMQKTSFPFELIIGEDESDDGTRQICIDYAEKYPDVIRLFLRSRKDVIYISGSPTGRYNFIENIKSAKGKYIALLPGDDYWTDPLKLQKQVEFLENYPEYVISFHKSVNYDVEINKFQEAQYENLKNDKPIEQKWLTSGIYIPTATSCFRNNFILPENFNKVKNADTFLWAILGHQGKAIFQSNIAPSIRRVHPGGVFSMKEPIYKMNHMINSYKEMLVQTEGNYKTYLKTKICKSYILLSKIYFKDLKVLKYSSCMLQAFKHLQVNKYGMKVFFKTFFS